VRNLNLAQVTRILSVNHYVVFTVFVGAVGFRVQMLTYTFRSATVWILLTRNLQKPTWCLPSEQFENKCGRS